jgi:hypothetical protein
VLSEMVAKSRAVRLIIEGHGVTLFTGANRTLPNGLSAADQTLSLPT